MSAAEKAMAEKKVTTDYKTEFVVENISVELISAHPKNPKVHPLRQKEALDASMKDFGWLLPVVWNKRTGLLLDGHARFERAGNMGATVVPARVVDVDEATELRIIASLDRVGELRTYDDEALYALLAECAETGAPLPGWSEDDLAELLAAIDAPPARAAGSGTADGDAGEDGKERISGGPEAASEPTLALTAVKMVQLFFGPEDHAEFETLIGSLAADFGLNTPSDVVLQALRTAAEETDEQ